MFATFVLVPPEWFVVGVEAALVAGALVGLLALILLVLLLVWLARRGGDRTIREAGRAVIAGTCHARQAGVRRRRRHGSGRELTRLPGDGAERRLPDV
jgi:hypothetical protein